MHLLPCQGRIQNHETLSSAINNVSSREIHAEKYLAQAENIFVNGKYFFKKQERLVTCSGPKTKLLVTAELNMTHYLNTSV